MVCIYCGSPTQVQNSRPQKRLNQIWRRRGCTACGASFTTHEAVELSGSVSVARQNASPKLMPFSRDILFISIYESCKHRPTAIRDANALTQTTIALLRQGHKGATLQRNEIVSAAVTVLERFDSAAATMYKAYHPLPADSQR